MNRVSQSDINKRFPASQGVRPVFSRQWMAIVLLVLVTLLSSCASDAGARGMIAQSPSPENQVTNLATRTSSPTPTIPPPTKTPLPTSQPSSTPTQPPSPTIPGPPSPEHIIPDSEVVFTASASDFDTAVYLEQAGGFLGSYRQYLMITAWTDAPAVIDMVTIENSINPRLLVALLEYQCGCVLGDGKFTDPDEFTSAMGALQAQRQDFYGQLIWAIHELSEGYYGWKDGTLTEISFSDGTIAPLARDLNPGSVAVMYLFSRLYEGDAWEQAIDSQNGFPALYVQMFGNPWERAATLEPLIPADATQPELTLPFEPGIKWAYTGGPHKSYESNGPAAALDFAPPSDAKGCLPSPEWVTAMADGLIVRSDMGIVVQDLDGDGNEHTGWNLVYVHIGTDQRVPKGTYLKTGEPVGHPSCEGGRATGTHVHIIRKLNGEWMPADGLIPFVMDGWTAHAGEDIYLGTLTRGTEIIISSIFSAGTSHIIREEP